MTIQSADAVVVGGGVVGASAAFHLTSLGLRKVVLCERRILGAGATGASAGHVQTHITTAPEAHIAQLSLPYFLNWDDLVGAGSCGFVRTGYVRSRAPRR
jgi:sarcosine oxidase, subunit beta